MYRGAIDMKPPMLFSLGFIFLFLIGGFTGLVSGALAANVHIHDTAFVVGHFHYVMFGGTGFGFFAAMHYWFPKIFGKMYNIKRAKTSFWVIIIGFNQLYFSMLILGVMGMPRRYYDYLPEFHNLNIISTVGSWIMITGLTMMIVNLIKGVLNGEKASKNPWNALTLEWSTESPPPVENFDVIPTVKNGPYDFHLIENIEDNGES
jgi:cytochrome c oxidase subunit 1